MTHHEHSESDAEADASFERLLLRSANADALPDAATRQAWEKFASASAGVALVAGSGPGLGGVWHAARRASLKWLALGALGGSTITAAWLSTRSAPISTPRAASSLAAPIAPATAPSAPGKRAESSPSSVAPLEATAASEVDPTHRPSAAQEQALPQPNPTLKPLSSASSLAAEVAALDSVQRAITTRDFARALRLVAEYQRQFPRGQLTPDAEALAIEALESLGDRTELAARAARFLSRYPKDPHAARIATLVQP